MRSLSFLDKLHQRVANRSQSTKKMDWVGCNNLRQLGHHHEVFCRLHVHFFDQRMWEFNPQLMLSQRLTTQKLSAKKTTEIRPRPEVTWHPTWLPMSFPREVRTTLDSCDPSEKASHPTISAKRRSNTNGSSGMIRTHNAPPNIQTSIEVPSANSHHGEYSEDGVFAMRTK
jgi:hypothetical protein